METNVNTVTQTTCPHCKQVVNKQWCHYEESESESEAYYAKHNDKDGKECKLSQVEIEDNH